MTMRGSSYPRRQQYRRLRRAIVSAAIGATAGGLAVAAAGAGATAAAGALLLLMGGFLIDARRWLHLAARSRVGARSEDAVRQALSGLEADGWRVRHSLEWGGRGDIDSVAIAPTGIGFAIDSKTRTFDAVHLTRARDSAVWLRRHRRRWCRQGALPVLCVVHARGLEDVCDKVSRGVA
jgi:Nuclease-related domain